MRPARKSSKTAAACVVAVLVVAACPSPQAALTSGSSSTSSGESQAPECACIPEEPGNVYLDPPTCGEPMCFVEAHDNSNAAMVCGDGDLMLENEQQLECALTSLRAGTPGLVYWTLNPSGFCGDAGYALILEDRRVIVRDVTWLDMGSLVSDAVMGELPAPSYFDECLASPSLETRFRCLNFCATGERLEVCDVGDGSSTRCSG